LGALSVATTFPASSLSAVVTPNEKLAGGPVPVRAQQDVDPSVRLHPDAVTATMITSVAWRSPTSTFVMSAAAPESSEGSVFRSDRRWCRVLVVRDFADRPVPRDAACRGGRGADRDDRSASVLYNYTVE
jgi:hypothetical protein